MSALYIHGDHDSNLTFVDKEGKLTTIEYERYSKHRYDSYTPHMSGSQYSVDRKRAFLEYIKSIASPIEKIYFMSADPNTADQTEMSLFGEVFPGIEVEQMHNHHRYHCLYAYHLSGFDRAFILSMDGGGTASDERYSNLTWTNHYRGEGGRVDHLFFDEVTNMGMAYLSLGYFMSELTGNGLWKPRYDLAWPGKVMGLCAYGNVIEEWVPALEQYFKSPHAHVWQGKYQEVEALQESIGVELTENCFVGQQSYDFAATAQKAFENVVMSILDPYIEEYDNFIVTGGCALNVLLNQKLKKKLADLGKELYVPPNPNDCGLSLGMFYEHNPDTDLSFSVYNGMRLLDHGMLYDHIQERDATKVSTRDIVDLIKQGKIIGLVEGDSEVGPRALGNRSIICDPSNPNMKDILNHKVKFREWYRPFAPVCRLEDMHNYFDDAFESEYMSYAPTIKQEYREKLASVCHHDNTARLQTVREDQHKTFYNILTELNDRGEIPVILNTSFNIKGQPILSRITDALYCLDNTEMDYVIIDGWLFGK